ncbi:MAG TPA: DUF4388 domain-containing protein, partial [Kofleriaceae bacterium]|nr:DUF4388 domain-containing protein [Kofleriaceae bacterium]
IVRKALRKSVDERWQGAAQFRDALAEWLFDNRHRMTPKTVADVVVELRDSVVERRNKTVNAGTTVLDDIAVGRAPSDEAVPIAAVEGEPSMPIISVSYDQAHDPVIASRPVSVGDLAAAASPRAETVHARPARGPTAAPPPAGSGLQIKRPTGPPRGRPTPPRAARDVPLRELAMRDGIVELPIADTISAAVEAITLPVSDRTERVGQSDDSAMRAFDELSSPPVSREGAPNVAADAARRRQPTPPALSDIPEPPDDSGEFGITSPLRVLFRLMTARATGLLLVAVGGIKKEIYVRDGQPEYVSSNVASELFGNYLVSKSVLSDGELAMALAMMPHYGGKLGDTLVGLGLLKPLEVFRHLTRQVRTKIIDVCTWNKGSFGWYAGRENPREAFPLDFNAFEILGAGALALSDEFIEAWIARNAALRLRAARTRRVGPERFEVKGLIELCEMLDGKRSVFDLVEAAPDRPDRLRTGRMLTLLESCDLARPA